MSQERASWKVKGDGILRELVTLMDLSAAEKAALGRLCPTARELAPASVSHSIHSSTLHLSQGMPQAV